MKKIFLLIFVFVLTSYSVYALADCSQCGGVCLTSEEAVEQGLVKCLELDEPCDESGPLPKSCYKSPTCGNGICEESDLVSCVQDCPSDEEPEEDEVNITASRGSNNPASHTWYHNASSSDIWNEMFQLKIKNDRNEVITLNSITLRASGNGNDATDIDRIEVYADLNNNGVVDAEPRIGVAQPAYNQDNGQKTFALNYNIGVGETKNILIVYVMKANAPFGATYWFTVTNIKALGRTTGNLFDIGGLPKNSGAKTIVNPPAAPCTGPVGLDLIPDVTSAGKLVNANANNLRNCVGKKIELHGVPCNFLLRLAPQCSCVVGQLGNGCGCNFAAPLQDGDYTYHACVDIDGDNVVDPGEDGSDDLKVVTCQGVPSLELIPDKVVPSGQVVAELTGLNNCFGIANVIDARIMVQCMMNPLQDTLGSCTFLAPNKEGVYPYAVVVDVNGDGAISPSEFDFATLAVSKDLELEVPEEELTIPDIINIPAPGPQCGECEPSTWEECSCVGGNEGAQSGECRNNCGYGLVKVQACQCNQSGITYNFKNFYYTIQNTVSNKWYTVLPIVAAIILVVYLFYRIGASKKKIRR